MTFSDTFQQNLNFLLTFCNIFWSFLLPDSFQILPTFPTVPTYVLSFLTVLKKKKSKQTKPSKTKIPKQKNPTKNYRAYFVLVNNFWTWSLPWSVVDTPSVTSLEFPFASGYQSQIVSGLGVGSCVHLLFSGLGVCGGAWSIDN